MLIPIPFFSKIVFLGTIFNVPYMCYYTLLSGDFGGTRNISTLWAPFYSSCGGLQSLTTMVRPFTPSQNKLKTTDTFPQIFRWKTAFDTKGNQKIYSLKQVSFLVLEILGYLGSHFEGCLTPVIYMYFYAICKNQYKIVFALVSNI